MGIETLVAPYRRKLESLYTDNAASNYEIEGDMLETLKLNFIHLGHIQGEIFGALSTEINTHYYSHRWPIDEQWHVLTFWLDDNNYKWNLDVLGAIPFTEGQKFEGIAIDLVKKFVEPTPEGHSQARYKQIVDFWQEKSGRPPEPLRRSQEVATAQKEDVTSPQDAQFNDFEIGAIESILRQVIDHFPDDDKIKLDSHVKSLLNAVRDEGKIDNLQRDQGAFNSLKVLKWMNPQKRTFVACELYFMLLWLVDLNEKATELAQTIWRYLGMKVINGGWDFWDENDVATKNMHDLSFRKSLKPRTPFSPKATAPLIIGTERLDEFDNDGQMILWIKCPNRNSTLVLRCGREDRDLRFVAESADKQLQFPAFVTGTQPTAFQLLQFLSGSLDCPTINSIEPNSPLAWLFDDSFALAHGCSPVVISIEESGAGAIKTIQLTTPDEEYRESNIPRRGRRASNVVSFQMSSNSHLLSYNFIDLFDGSLATTS